jgi:hypothetical protein
VFRRRAGQASSSFRGNATFVDAASMTLRLTAPGKRPSSRLIPQRSCSRKRQK